MFRRATRSTSEGLVVLARKNGTVRPRLGLAISRKFTKSAVRRNRIKRIIRESFRAHQEELRGLDVVVVSRPGISAIRDEAMPAVLARHWRSVSRGSAPD